MIFVGGEWAEAHHEVWVLDTTGAVLGRRRVPDGVAGVAQFHALVADHASGPEDVVVGSSWIVGCWRPGGSGQPVGGQPLPGAPWDLGGQVRPGGRHGLG